MQTVYYLHMRTINHLILPALACLIAFTYCAKPETPNQPQDPKPPIEEPEKPEKPEEPEKPEKPEEPEVPGVSVDIPFSNLNLTPGQSFQLKASVIPEDSPLSWQSTNENVLSVDDSGNVTTLNLGCAAIVASSKGQKDSCWINVANPPAFGDYYYADGSYSSTLDLAKNPIGLVFWVGDPTADDAALKRDYPFCTHGLVVAFSDDQKGYHFQKNFRMYYKSLGYWIEANAPEYETVTTKVDDFTILNLIRGYNNTKAIEAFNAADENKEWPVNLIAGLEDYRKTVPAPSGSSGWYIPSTKECCLIIVGDVPGDVVDLHGNVDNKNLLNKKLKVIPGSNSIGREGIDDDIWTSNDRDEIYALYVSTHEGKIWMQYKQSPPDQNKPSEYHRLRCVLAF